MSTADDLLSAAHEELSRARKALNDAIRTMRKARKDSGLCANCGKTSDGRYRCRHCRGKESPPSPVV